MYFEKPYYLVPGKKAEKAYVLLHEVLRRTGKVGIARVVIRTRQYLAMLMPREDALVLNLLRFPQEIVSADEFSFPSGALTKYRISATELRMGEELPKSMSGKWNAADCKDEFRDKLRKLIQKHVDKEQGSATFADKGEKLPEHAATNVVDFMPLLKKSLAANAKSPARTKPSATKKRARKRA